MLTKNLYTNPLFWSIVAAFILNVVPSVQKVRVEKQLPVDALLTVLFSVGVAINTVSQLYHSSGTVYYTPKSLPGLNKEEADLLASSSDKDGNF